MTSETLLRVNSLCVCVNAARLLDSISLQLGCGEVVSVIGPNGAGKTSLLRAIAGDFLQHNAIVSGSVRLSGRELERWPLAARALQMGVLPQASSLNFPFLVSEVIALGRAPHSSGYAHDQQIVQAAAEMTDVSHLLPRLYTQLSGGEKQRVQLARVFAQLWDNEGTLPRLLLLDEPMQALDYGHQRQVLRAIQDLAGQGVAVLQVMHDVNLAAQCSQRILALVAGQTRFLGDVEQLMRPDILQQIFGVELQIVRHPRDGHPVLV